MSTTIFRKSFGFSDNETEVSERVRTVTQGAQSLVSPLQSFYLKSTLIRNRFLYLRQAQAGSTVISSAPQMGFTTEAALKWIV
jgi:hypothetical protein